MSVSRKIILLVAVGGIFIFSFGQPTGLLAKVKGPLSGQVKVSARVGKYSIESLTGWASPYAEITLSSTGLLQKTTAKADGSFTFSSIPLPDKVGELCLVAQDANQFPSFPLCLAPPLGNQNILIKDVLLSPTLGLEGGQISNGETAKASGMTFPNSLTHVYLFTESHFSFWSRILEIFKLSRPAYALGLPKYEIQSNSNGFFEFSLPATLPSQNRVYVASVFSLADRPDLAGSYSPKSNTLAFETLGLLSLLRLFWDNFFPWIILLGLCLLTGMIIILINKNRKKKENEEKL